MEVKNIKKMRPLSEREARTEILRLEKEFGVKYPKMEKEKAVKRMLGKAPWFD